MRSSTHGGLWRVAWTIAWRGLHTYVRRPDLLVPSLVFPLVFLLNGFYTRSRAYIGRYKMVVVMRGAGIGILTLLAVNYLFFRTNLVPRLALLFFALLTIIGLSLTRLAKALLQERYPGQYGNETMSVLNIRLARVDAEKHLLMLQGGIPGARNGMVLIRTAVKTKKRSTKR